VIRNGETLFLDAGNGELTVSPDTEQVMLGQQKRKKWQERRNAASSYLEKPLSTMDGERIQIGLNIGSDEDDIPKYVDFIGLFRTEFLYMNDDRLPTEDEQFAAYCRVLQKAGTRTVTLRTLDIGGTRPLPICNCRRKRTRFLASALYGYASMSPICF
jgi:phosphotransferase system enzyme I (PtsI)